MVFLLAYLNETRNYQTQIIATARNIEKARDKFSDLVGKDYFTLIPYDVEERLEYDGKVDYIIHAASNASPTAILSNPVSIIKANTIGTLNLLDFAKEKTIENFLFLSTREVYGLYCKVTMINIRYPLLLLVLHIHLVLVWSLVTMVVL